MQSEEKEKLISWRLFIKSLIKRNDTKISIKTDAFENLLYTE